MKEIIHAQTFSHHPNLKRHERTHHGVKAKSGNNFGIFDEPMKTAEPKKTKSSPKMSSCNHCPKSYSTPYLLKYHIRKKHLLETESERAVHQGPTMFGIYTAAAEMENDYEDTDNSFHSSDDLKEPSDDNEDIDNEYTSEDYEDMDNEDHDNTFNYGDNVVEDDAMDTSNGNITTEVMEEWHG